MSDPTYPIQTNKKKAMSLELSIHHPSMDDRVKLKLDLGIHISIGNVRTPRPKPCLRDPSTFAWFALEFRRRRCRARVIDSTSTARLLYAYARVHRTHQLASSSSSPCTVGSHGSGVTARTESWRPQNMLVAVAAACYYM